MTIVRRSGTAERTFFPWADGMKVQAEKDIHPGKIVELISSLLKNTKHKESHRPKVDTPKPDVSHKEKF
ncbi:MAG: hypothetical protein LBN96_07540 [Desulfovibrio sp.]|jgi:hypothetical protein|nr:hypothetical protein [Desulfovibrio sp.]